MATNRKILERQGKSKSKKIDLYKFQQYEAFCSCGCCKETLYFNNGESALAAMTKVGLNSVGTVVDDAGLTHTSIDTFYGLIKLTKQELKKRREEAEARRKRKPWG